MMSQPQAWLTVNMHVATFKAAESDAATNEFLIIVLRSTCLYVQAFGASVNLKDPD